MFRLLRQNLKWFHYVLMAVAAVLIYANVRFDLQMTKVMGKIINELIMNTEPQTSTIWKLGGEMLLYSLATGGITILVGFVASRIGTDFSHAVRGEIFLKVNGFSQEQMETFSVPSLITRTTNDIQQMQMVLIIGIRMLINAPITAFLAIREIQNINVKLSLVVGIVVCAIVALILIVFLIAYPKVKVMQQKTDRLNQVTRESLTGVRVVRAHGSEDFQEKRFSKANDELTKNYYFVNVAMSFLMPGMNLLMTSASVIITWVAATIMSKQSIGVLGYDDVMMFTQYSMSIIISFMMLIMLFVMIPRAMVSARRVNEVLKSQSKLLIPSEPSPVPTENMEITFENVSFKYPGAEGYILRDINFTVSEGETLAIIGSTGSGKSTLIDLIPRFFDATEGKVMISGIDVKNFNTKELNKIIGYVPQQGYLFSGNIDYNVKLGIPETGMEEHEITEALRISQSEEFVSKLPELTNHHIVQAGTNVSGGQRQRLCIARAVAKEPKIYIFDDSFSALDYKTDGLVRDAIKKTTKHGINVIVAQRVGTIIDADKIIVLEKGQMVGFGKHKDLLKTSKEYQEIAYSQLSEEELA